MIQTAGEEGEMRRLCWLAVAVLTLSLSGCILFLVVDDVLYEETFDEVAQSPWPRTSTESFDRWIDGGKYHILVKEAVYAYALNLTEGPFDDVQIDLDVDHVLGASGVAAGGLLFRALDYMNSYAFLVSPAGTFSVVKWVAGTRTTLLAWAASPAILKDAARNHLTVLAQGTSLSFWVNGTQVAMLTDASFSTGRVGVVVAAYDANVDVLQAVDNLVVQAAD